MLRVCLLGGNLDGDFLLEGVLDDGDLLLGGVLDGDLLHEPGGEQLTYSSFAM